MTIPTFESAVDAMDYIERHAIMPSDIKAELAVVRVRRELANYEQLSRKVRHGCVDAMCAECDLGGQIDATG